jgi:hypothetical protein
MNAHLSQWEMFEPTLTQKFWDFDKANPHVYRRLVSLARRAKIRGIRHYSVDALFHILRWEIAIKTRGEEEFRLNNNFTAFYARLISDREPDLKDFFTLRERRAK